MNGRINPVRPVAGVSVASVGHDEKEITHAPDRRVNLHAASTLGGNDRAGKELASGLLGVAVGRLIGGGGALKLEFRSDLFLIEILWWIVILVLQERVQVNAARHLGARFGDRFSGRPENRVGDEATHIVVSPVPVVVATGESERASAIRTFECPGHRLPVSAGNTLSNIGVTAVWPILPPHRIGGSDSAQNGDHFVRGVEPHVEVPLVVGCERFDSMGDRMRG